MEFQSLTEFLALADTLNFSRAATRLHMSGAALTRHIQRLERDLEVTLFDRTPPLSLTAAGRELLPKADKLVKDTERLKSEIRRAGEPQRTVLNIGFLPGLLHLSLTGALARFRRRNKTVRVRLHEMSLRDQASALVREELDVAIVGHPWPELSRDVDLFDLGSIPLCAVVSSTHPLAGTNFDLKDLRKEEFVRLCDEVWPGQTACMTAACGKAGFEPNFTATAAGKSALLIMVGSSHRVGLLPATANKIPHAGADFHPLSWQVPCCAAVRRGERRPAVREFLRGFRQEFLKVARSFGFSTRPSPPSALNEHQKIPLPHSDSSHAA
ncbi:MAG: LysR family transcriptional regulator [Verrucomicrobiota bacterium]